MVGLPYLKSSHAHDHYTITTENHHSAQLNINTTSSVQNHCQRKSNLRGPGTSPPKITTLLAACATLLAARANLLAAYANLLAA